MLAPWKKSYDQPRQHIKKQRHYFANKGPSGQGYGFFSSHVGMWELDYKESWALKNWCFWTMVLEKTLESPLDCKEIQPVHPKGNQSWVFIGRTDVEAQLQYFGHLMWRVDSLEKTLMLGGIGGRRRGDDRGWNGWMASSTWWTWVWVNSGSWWWTRRPGMLQFMGSKESDMTEWLNWTELNQGDNTPPWHTPFPIQNQSVAPFPVLSVASWPAYISQEAGQVVWYSHLLKIFPQFVVIHTVKGLA